MFISLSKMEPLTNGFKPRISTCKLTFFAIILLLTIHTLTANAKSVVDTDPFHGNHHEQHNQLVSNRHQNSGTSEGSASSARLTQSSGFNGNQNRCQQGWMWVKNKCLVTTQSRRDFLHAMELCKRMYNSTLPTIHSEEENEFLKQNLNLINSPIWLFARHNHQYNKTRWLDKSPVDFTNWDDGQPSDKSSLVCIKTEDSWYMKKATPTDGQTECVSFWDDSKWGTNVGCQVLLPVVCEKKLTPVSRMTGGTDAGDQGDSLSRLSDQQMATMTGASSPESQANIFQIISFALAAMILIAKAI